MAGSRNCFTPQRDIYSPWWSSCYAVRVDFYSNICRQAYLRSDFPAEGHIRAGSHMRLCPGSSAVRVEVRPKWVRIEIVFQALKTRQARQR